MISDLISDFGEKLEKINSVSSNIKSEVRKMLEDLAEKLELAQANDLHIQEKILAKAMIKIEELEKRVAELEKKEGN